MVDKTTGPQGEAARQSNNPTLEKMLKSKPTTWNPTPSSSAAASSGNKGMNPFYASDLYLCHFSDTPKIQKITTVSQEEFKKITTVSQEEFKKKTPAAQQLLHSFVKKIPPPPPGLPIRLPEPRPTPEPICSKPSSIITHPPPPASTKATQENLASQRITVSQTFHPTPLRNPPTPTIALDKTPMETSALHVETHDKLPDQIGLGLLPPRLKYVISASKRTRRKKNLRGSLNSSKGHQNIHFWKTSAMEPK